MSNLPLFITPNVLNQAIEELKAIENMAHEQLKQSKMKVTNLEAELVVIIDQKEKLR